MKFSSSVIRIIWNHFDLTSLDTPSRLSGYFKDNCSYSLGSGSNKNISLWVLGCSKYNCFSRSGIRITSEHFISLLRVLHDQLLLPIKIICEHILLKSTGTGTYCWNGRYTHTVLSQCSPILQMALFFQNWQNPTVAKINIWWNLLFNLFLFSNCFFIRSVCNTVIQSPRATANLMSSPDIKNIFRHFIISNHSWSCW